MSNMIKNNAKNNIWIIPIEPIDQRYTKQWYENIPVLLNEASTKYNIITVDGTQRTSGTTAGAFLDFAVTNAYKASQIERIACFFENGIVKAGDKFLVTDAWNYAIIAIRYMSELLDIPVEIHSIWHAGAYDPTDILGMKMSKPWPWHFERSCYYASDYNYFATEFHAKLFRNNLHVVSDTFLRKSVVSGQPHNLNIPHLIRHTYNTKKNCVVWPHRYNDDKQPEIAEDLASVFDVVITQKMNLKKEDYYKVLGDSKVTFSCSLHENLGISMMEATLCGSIPIVPNRASYQEMYLDCFKYPSEWTASHQQYIENKDKLIDFINDKVYNYDKFLEKLEEQKNILINKYMTAQVMINNIVGNGDSE